LERRLQVEVDGTVFARITFTYKHTRINIPPIDILKANLSSEVIF